MTQKMWLTKDLPYTKEHFYKFYKKMPAVKKLAESFYNDKELDGYPVYTETKMSMMGMNVESSSELILITEKSFSNDLFGQERIVDSITSLPSLTSMINLISGNNFKKRLIFVESGHFRRRSFLINSLEKESNPSPNFFNKISL